MARLTHPQFIRNRRRRLLLDATYQDKLLATNPIAYWPLNEGSGTTITELAGVGNGTYTGVTWDGTQHHGEPAPYFDGANDYGAIYTAALAAAVDFDEGSLNIWVKATTAFWNSTTPFYAMQIFRDSSNVLSIFKPGSANQIWMRRVGAAATHTVQITGVGGEDWIHFGMRWSVSGDELAAYVNGVPAGTPQSGLLAATGAITLVPAGTLVGAIINTPAQVLDGYLHDALIHDKVLTDNDFTSIYQGGL